MKAVILAAGYATRLYPLTESVPKQLLPIAGVPIVDRILAKVRETSADEIHLVTNARFAAEFRSWAEGKDVQVHDDGTTSNDDRLGAVGDIRFVQEHADLDDELFVVAGDNLFDYSMSEYERFWRTKDGSAIAVYDVGDLALASQYGIVSVDDDDRVTECVEKPANPSSTLAATAAYLYTREHAALVDGYLRDGNPADAPGSFVVWLCERAPVYAWRFGGDWYDIGDRGELLRADNRMRRREGLPERDAYAPD
jgi:glucose-1-phosphate thymidylyltransferase